MKLILLWLLFLTWGFILTAWFVPETFKLLGAFFYALGEASEGIQSTFSRRFREHRRKGLQPSAPDRPGEQKNPVHDDLVTAMVAQGASRKQAVSVIASLPRDISFTRGFQIATAKLREQAA